MQDIRCVQVKEGSDKNELFREYRYTIGYARIVDRSSHHGSSADRAFKHEEGYQSFWQQGQDCSNERAAEYS